MTCESTCSTPRRTRPATTANLRRCRQRDRLEGTTGCKLRLRTLTRRATSVFTDFARRAVLGARVRNSSRPRQAREMGELLFGLRRRGDPVGISQGAGSIASFPIGVRCSQQRLRGPDPRGDIFSGDDPQSMGAIHPGDCFTYLPIFHSGRVVAWAAGMNIIDVGSMIGGSWPPFSQDTFTGFVVPLTKTGENYEYTPGG
jgi:hypothetical protein